MDKQLQTSANKCPLSIVPVKRLNIISTEALWKYTNRKAVHITINNANGVDVRFTGRSLGQKMSSPEEFSVGSCPRGRLARGDGGRRITMWNRTIDMEIGYAGRTWSETRTFLKLGLKTKTFVVVSCSSEE